MATTAQKIRYILGTIATVAAVSDFITISPFNPNLRQSYIF